MYKGDLGSNFTKHVSELVREELATASSATIHLDSGGRHLPNIISKTDQYLIHQLIAEFPPALAFHREAMHVAFPITGLSAPGAV